jgi:hypothetical protein
MALQLGVDPYRGLRPMKVLVLGSNPSSRSPDKTAFNPMTRSGKMMRGLMSAVQDENLEIVYANVSDEPTPKNRPLLVSEIHASLATLKEKLVGIDKVIVVGNTAAYAVTLLSISGMDLKFLQVAHASGRCRKWNDAAYKEQALEKLREFIR